MEKTRSTKTQDLNNYSSTWDLTDWKKLIKSSLYLHVLFQKIFVTFYEQFLKK